MEFSRSLVVIEYLSTLWQLHRTPDFADYLGDTYGCEIPVLPKFEAIYVAEMASGKASDGVMGGEVARWWLINDEGCREVGIERLELRIDGEFYTTPMVKFFAELDRVAIGELLGPKMCCLKVGVFDPESPDCPISHLRVISCYYHR